MVKQGLVGAVEQGPWFLCLGGSWKQLWFCSGQKLEMAGKVGWAFCLALVSLSFLLNAHFCLETL